MSSLHRSKGDDLVARAFQQGTLAAKNSILATGGRGPVLVVGQKNFQLRENDKLYPTAQAF